MQHDLSHLGFLAGQIGRLITISTSPVLAGYSYTVVADGRCRRPACLACQSDRLPNSAATTGTTIDALDMDSISCLILAPLSPYLGMFSNAYNRLLNVTHFFFFFKQKTAYEI